MLLIDKILVLKDVDSIYKSLSDILCTNETTIKWFIARKSIFYRQLEDVSLDDFFEKIFDEQIKKDDLYARIKFDWVTVSHFSSRLDDKNIEKKPLYNLFDALINDTDLSFYMKENGFQFKKEKNSIITFYKGEKVSWEDFYEEELVGYDACLIKSRLIREEKNKNDKCINGFLFGEDLYRNNYVKTILAGCPEIIKNICNVLGRKDMIKYIQDNSKNYVITFKQKVSNIIFDYSNELNYESKVYRIYKYVILYLCLKFCNRWDEGNNPIIRLKDYINVSVDNIVELKKIDVKW
ncbi:hypothetical protein [Clostridium ljungdahlii]|uniref:Uncharacterized protein n=1 Tax=Clostridium ljungdahlii (strain ATCC 55383 / DSM 13528 / PETC) TaxID=748727 RepID=D8GU93_CLOLD|nr:hypothetical protein [Clostridium ljungdahlii]ADK14756.1 hypothetical protein CLJU_c16920 [Clostridium ljungdahlii DSM 13528]OAA84113.1 hypothetical protein WX45_01957 [Clostridium ljungdahlii DSM 13528]